MLVLKEFKKGSIQTTLVLIGSNTIIGSLKTIYKMYHYLFPGLFLFDVFVTPILRLLQ